jgi:aminoglycoside phosphotransferase (APT) family kinase protein
MVTRYLDSLLAKGTTSDVYAWGTDAVVKLLRRDIPVEWAAREAETTRLVHAAGLPAPAVFDLIAIDDRPGIVLERITGVSMWERMRAHPDDIAGLATTLAGLQAEINTTPAPSGLPKLARRLEENIASAQVLSAAEREMAQAELNLLVGDDALCHFDIHPNNVLMDPSQPVVIDWFDACTGSTAADIVRASVLMRRDAAAAHLPCSNPSLIDLAHDEYLASVAGIRQIDHNLLLDWEPSVLAGRLAEPLSEGARRATYEAWRTRRSSHPTQLESSLRSTGST